MKKVRVFIYCRVGRKDQLAQAGQVNALRAYTQMAGYEEVGLAAEYGVFHTADRPGLNRATQAIIDGNADMVLVHNICRFGRDRHMVQDYIGLLAKYGGKLCCLKEGLTLPEA